MANRHVTAGALSGSALFLCVSLLLLLGASARASGVELAQVRSALDGDSLLLADGRQVRAIGLNAPEFGKAGAADQPLAREAANRANALARGLTVRLVYDHERFDRYGRTLAYVFLPDGRDFQELLLREGLAWFVAIPPNTARLSVYRAAEADARAAKRGVWGRPEYRPVPADQVPSGLAGFRQVTGIVGSVRTKGDTVELQLAPHVRLLMARRVALTLAPAPQYLQGKRVLARGWLAAYKGNSRLRITHSAMVEVLP